MNAKPMGMINKAAGLQKADKGMARRKAVIDNKQKTAVLREFSRRKRG